MEASEQSAPVAPAPVEKPAAPGIVIKIGENQLGYDLNEEGAKSELALAVADIDLKLAPESVTVRREIARAINRKCLEIIKRTAGDFYAQAIAAGNHPTAEVFDSFKAFYRTVDDIVWPSALSVLEANKCGTKHETTRYIIESCDYFAGFVVKVCQKRDDVLAFASAMASVYEEMARLIATNKLSDIDGSVHDGSGGGSKVRGRNDIARTSIGAMTVDRKVLKFFADKEPQPTAAPSSGVVGEPEKEESSSSSDDEDDDEDEEEYVDNGTSDDDDDADFDKNVSEPESDIGLVQDGAGSEHEDHEEGEVATEDDAEEEEEEESKHKRHKKHSSKSEPSTKKHKNVD